MSPVLRPTPHAEAGGAGVPPAEETRTEPPGLFTITVTCTPVSPLHAEALAASEPDGAAWLETTLDGTTWTRRCRVTPASLVNTFVSSAPLRDVRIVSDAPGPPAYDVREVVLVN